jgi:phosphatidylinositol alpha-mannosyltransferase
LPFQLVLPDASMRVVQVSPYDLSRHGGVQQHVLSLAAEFRRRGHEVLTVGPGTGVMDNDQNLGIGRKRIVSLLGTSFELSLATKTELRALAGRLADWRPHIIHYHTMWVPFLPMQIFRQTQVASVATFHDTPPPGVMGSVLRNAFKPMSWLLLRHLDGAMAVSPAPLGHLRPGRFGAQPMILPPATDLSEFLAVEKTAEMDQQTVLFVGRLEPRKGIKVLLDAWQQIAGGRVGLPQGLKMPRLVVAGSGELETMVVEASHRLGDACLHHEPAPDRRRLLQLFSGASVAVSPALYGESFGIILVEALASGTPIIASSNAGYVHVLTGRGRDLLVRPGDADALARKIVELLANRSERLSLGAWGRHHARQFDVAAVASEFERVYRTAIGNYARSKGHDVGNQV